MKGHPKGQHWTCPECARLAGMTFCDAPSYIRRLRRQQKNFLARISLLFITLPLGLILLLVSLNGEPPRALVPPASGVPVPSTLGNSNPMDSRQLRNSLERNLRKPRRTPQEESERTASV